MVRKPTIETEDEAQEPKVMVITMEQLILDKISQIEAGQYEIAQKIIELSEKVGVNILPKEQQATE